MRRLYLAMLACLLWCCAAERSTQAAPRQRAGRTVFTPSTPSAERKEEARSTIPLLLGLELAWAKDELQQRIPERLHHEQGRALAPGISLDVQVTRRDFELRASGDSVGVSTDLLLDLDVRTKWGNLARRLGKCRALVVVDVALSLRLSPDGKLAAPSASATLREPCRLSGFDLTPIIQQEIAQRLSAAREQTSRQLDEVNVRLTQLAHELARRAAQPASGCLRFLPDKLLQGPIASEGEVLSTWLALNGKVTDDCNVRSSSDLVIERVATAPRFDLIWSHWISLPEFGGGLAKHLAGSNEARILALRTAQLEGRDYLAIRVRTPHDTDWILVRPEIREGSLKLVALQSKTRRLLDELRAALEAFSWSFRYEAPDLLSDQLASMAREYSQWIGANAELKQRQLRALSDLVTTTEVWLDPKGLLVLRRHRSTLEP